MPGTSYIGPGIYEYVRKYKNHLDLILRPQQSLHFRTKCLFLRFCSPGYVFFLSVRGHDRHAATSHFLATVTHSATLKSSQGSPPCVQLSAYMYITVRPGVLTYCCWQLTVENHAIPAHLSSKLVRVHAKIPKHTKNRLDQFVPGVATLKILTTNSIRFG